MKNAESCLLLDGPLGDMTPRPKRQPQEGVEKLHSFGEAQGQYVGLVSQMDAQFGQSIAPAAAKKNG